MNGVYLYFVNKHLTSWALLGLKQTFLKQNFLSSKSCSYISKGGLATSFLCPLSIVVDDGCLEKLPVAWKEYFASF